MNICTAQPKPKLWCARFSALHGQTLYLQLLELPFPLAQICLVQALLDQVIVVGVVLRLLVHMELLLPPGLQHVVLLVVKLNFV